MSGVRSTSSDRMSRVEIGRRLAAATARKIAAWLRGDPGVRRDAGYVACGSKAANAIADLIEGGVWRT